MNRYLLFAGYNYYPSGGIRDYRGSFPTMQRVVVNIGKADWWNVLDNYTGKIIDSYDHGIPRDASIIDWAIAFDEQMDIEDE